MPVHIAVCIATRDRPVWLRRLLTSLDAQEVPAEVHVSIVVADNDPRGTVHRIATELQASYSTPIHVLHAPQPGLSAPRNAGVAAALEANADWIAFIDDDEEAPADWLASLLLSAAHNDAAVVTGPLEPLHPAGTPEHRKTAGGYGIERRPDGQPMTIAYTHNTMVRAEVFDDVRPWFQPAFDFGGEDSDFFTRVALGGHRMVWAANSTVQEHVPEHKVTLRGIARRGLLTGTVKGTLARPGLTGTWSGAVKRIAAALVLLGRGLGQLVRGPFTSGRSIARGLYLLTFGLGQLRGVITGRTPRKSYSRTPTLHS